jgi:hypothetical protein
MCRLLCVADGMAMALPMFRRNLLSGSRMPQALLIMS